MTYRYLTAALSGVRFALPLNTLEEVRTNAITAAIPHPPAGVCGIVYDTTAILPLFHVPNTPAVPAAIQILCRIHGRRIAYTADHIGDTLELSAEQLRTLSDSDSEPSVLIAPDGHPLLFPTLDQKDEAPT